jgi:hypothetical protein
MNHGNCDTAVDMLKAQFDRSDGGVGQVHQAWYSIWGDVVSCFSSSFNTSLDEKPLFLTLDIKIGCILLY